MVVVSTGCAIAVDHAFNCNDRMSWGVGHECANALLLQNKSCYVYNDAHAKGIL